MYKHRKKKGKGPQERNEVVVTVRSKLYQGEGKCEHGFNVVGKLFIVGKKGGKREKSVLYQSTFPHPYLTEGWLICLIDRNKEQKTSN